ncbi:MAG: redoxin domain-containing protein [Proteobacteria bacterium]|nr:redoxin domain-containing protein [Pseudomonadota bacterium]
MRSTLIRGALIRAASLLASACALQPFPAQAGGQEMAFAAGQELIGKPAPRLVLRTIDGASIDLGKLYGRQAVYLKFWATWCVPCREQMPHFERTYEAAGPDLAVIAIDTGFNDSLDEVLKYRQRLGIKMPIVLDDGAAGAAFNLRVTPQHVVIGRDGRVQYVGHLADAQLDAALLKARTEPASQSAGAGGAAPPLVHYHAGDALPNWSPKTIDGAAMPLADPDAKRATLLVFLSPWCESYLATTRPVLSKNCALMRERVDALAAAMPVRWLGIASGLWATEADLADYRKQRNVTIPLALDESGKLFRAFDVMQVPTALLIGADGRVARRIELNDFASADALRDALGAVR